MGQTAESIGANVFQFFTRNPRGGAAKALDKADVAAFLDFAAAKEIGPILAHAPYTLNAAGSEARVREFAESVMTDDLKRLEATPGALYNFHPGSHVGQGIEKGIELISGMLGRIIASFGGNIATTILLETMAGKGSEVGGTFEELREIMDRTDYPLGVCLDTCHIWDGGYDIVNDLDGVLEKFDRAVGIGKLKAIHINAKIGKGKIGLDAFAAIVNHPQLKDLPFYLETPCDLQGYKEEIALLKGLVK